MTNTGRRGFLFFFIGWMWKETNRYFSQIAGWLYDNQINYYSVEFEVMSLVHVCMYTYMYIYE